ncbi:N-acetylglucosamine 6-phosphate deacetylase [Pediococcus ethanolidurans]|uniref:N-acetylglucosamine 6-phosphate deacetylase n=1 Tax=Pediococcus ethanolidurans TaxID=319653 RepID=A0A0R2K1Z3_9LACO|nr:N-acetylglucosamine 6-phosphate deacetylase [Pediococcus ethanolidurans]
MKFVHNSKYKCDIDYGDSFIVPGFIDLHIHGGYDADVLDDNANSFERVRQHLLSEGTTSFLATSTTLKKDELIKRLKTLGHKIRDQNIDSGSNCLGIHLEGPFINPQYAGAQNRESIITPTIEDFKSFNDASSNTIKRVTIAPEKDSNLLLIRYLHDHKILVSMGHSGASFQDAKNGETAGAKLVTHMFNGMPQIHHRELALSGYALLSDSLVCEFIADGIHINFNTVNLLNKIKTSKKLILITDSNRTKGLPLGEYELHGRQVQLNVDGSVRLKKAGTLAGSILKMNHAVKNVIQNSSIEQVEAFKMASLYPAQLLNISNSKGRLDQGYDADITILDSNYEVTETFIHGKRMEQNK